MKTFMIIDDNKPMGFCLNCLGCTLVPGKQDRIQVYTMEGLTHDVVLLPHHLSLFLYDKLLECAMKGGIIKIPDFEGKEDDEIRVMIDEIVIEEQK